MAKQINMLILAGLLITSSVQSAPLSGLESSGKSELTWYLISVYQAQLFYFIRSIYLW